MKFATITIALSLIVSSAFAVNPTVSDERVTSIFNKIVENSCEGNDSGGISRFKTAKFNAVKAMKSIRDNMNDCKGMRNSTSKEGAVAAFLKYLEKSDDDFSKCVDDALTDDEMADLIEMVKDPSNLGVFSSQYDGKDESEACYFHHFDIYRASGMKVSIVHDETD